MRLLKYLTAAVISLSLLSSCSVLKNAAANVLTTGSNTGSAITALYRVLQTAGNIDLSNVTNLINLGKILTGANTVSNASTSILDQFTRGLISGSTGLITNSNASGVISGLQTLANLDTSAIARAAASAAAGTVTTPITNSTPGVSATLSQLNSIFNLLK